jgi:hypothetical protein
VGASGTIGVRATTLAALNVRPVDFRWKTSPTNSTLEDVNTGLGVQREDDRNACNAVFAVLLNIRPASRRRGVALLKLTFSLLPDGNMTSSSEYFKGKTRVPGGHEFHYRADPDAKLVFLKP